MQDNEISGGDLITTEQFNMQASKWSSDTRKLLAANISMLSSKGKGDLLKSLKKQDKLMGGEVRKITFNFARHGVFWSYGVGNGYVRMDGKVIRGRLATKEEKAYAKAKTRTIGKVMYNPDDINRELVDWFDGKIDENIPKLADLVSEYWGDKAMLQASKMKIVK